MRCLSLNRILDAILVLALILWIVPAHGQVSREETERIQSAAPAKSTMKPAKARKILVFSHSEGYQHSAIPRATIALDALGKKTGAFETAHSDDLSVFRLENLQQFDAVCLNNTTQLSFDNPEWRRALLDFVAGGKGLIGIHSATDNFLTWPEGQEMLGGTFDGHPWTSDGTWAVKIEDPGHPLNAAFQGKGFLLKDEIYRIKQVNLRKTSRVLVGLDMKAEVNRKASGVRATDRDLPISWVRSFGKGRVFYCSLGHNDEIYANPAIMQHYLDGIQFALGDYPVDTTPLPFDPMSFFDKDSLKTLLRKAAGYQPGQSRAVLTDLDALARGVHDLPEARQAMEREFLDFLKSDASLSGKQFVASRLAQIGSDTSVLPLASMLADVATADMALYALEAIGGDRVGRVLHGVLPQVKGRVLVGVINVLGNLRVKDAAENLSAFIEHTDALVADAAIAAVGKIGSAGLIDRLGAAKERSTGTRRVNICEALLNCAEGLRVSGERERALAVYASLSTPLDPPSVRCAALRGKVLADPANAATAIKAALTGADMALHPMAAQLVERVAAIEDVRALARLVPALPASSQVQLLSALSRFRDRTVQDVVSAACSSKDPGVRRAGLRALGVMGDASVAAKLAQSAATAKGEEQKEARNSLSVLQAQGVDDTLVALLPRANAQTKIELMKAIGERRTASAVPVLLQAAADRLPAVRTEAARALKSAAKPSDLPALVELLVRTRDDRQRQELELGVASVARQIPDRRRQDETVLATYTTVSEPGVRASLVKVLGSIGAPASLPVLRSALDDKSPLVRGAAIQALTAWPTAEPYPDLWKLATGASDRSVRTLALRGAVSLIGLDTSKSPDQIVQMYRDALSVAPNAGESKLLLSAVGQTRTVAALRLASIYLEDRTLREEAEAAMLLISESLGKNARQETVPLLHRLIEVSSDTSRIEQAKALIKAIE